MGPEILKKINGSPVQPTDVLAGLLALGFAYAMAKKISPDKDNKSRMLEEYYRSGLTPPTTTSYWAKKVKEESH